jgi:hypothetical protein
MESGSDFSDIPGRTDDVRSSGQSGSRKKETPDLGAKFSRSALDQVALLATRVQPLASQDLARTIDEVRAVLAEGIGLDYEGLLRLAGDRQPTGERDASVD